MNHTIRLLCGLAIIVYLFYLYLFPAVSNATDVAHWIDKAQALGVHQSRPWQVLVHYKPEANGWKSLISDPRFFLASTGRYDPALELEATIRGLFESADIGKAHPLCRFPARAEWLKKVLSIPDNELPFGLCEENKRLLDRIAPHEAVLVFPSPRMGGPGALLGHTLLRIDAKERNPLISYSVSYAALTRGASVGSYFRKGLTGGFKGYYSLLPYYRKLNEYSDIEERDIWEYPINLLPEEVHMMALHAIELREIASDYYFLDENCAFNILFLIEAARPELRILERYWSKGAFWVIPSDTVQRLWNAGILKSPFYRPSLSTQIDWLSRNTPAALRVAALKLLKKDSSAIKSLIPKEKATASKLASKTLQLRFSRLEMTQEEFESQYAELMKEGRNAPQQEMAPPLAPHEGHPAGRLRIVAGHGDNSPFFEAEWRPAYHDLRDHPAGYPEGNNLSILNLKGRYYPLQHSFRLQQLELIRVNSFNPYNPFTRPVSWSMHVGAYRQYLHDGDDHLLFRLDTGAGQLHRNELAGSIWWMLKGSLVSGGGLDEGVDAGFGVEVGGVRTFGRRWQAHATWETTYYGVSERGFSNRLNTGFIYTQFYDSAFSVLVTLSNSGGGRFVPEVLLGWQKYF